MRTPTLRTISLLLTTILVAAACGDGDSSNTSDTTSTQPDSSTQPIDASTTSSSSIAPVPGDAPAPPSTTGVTASPHPVGGEAGDGNVEELQEFLSQPGPDGPFYMVNLIRYREQAEYPDGRATDLTGEAAAAIYGEFMRRTKLPETGAEIVYAGLVEQDVVGGTDFDRVAVVRYPSRAAFAAMISAPDFQEMSVHKRAGVEDTVAMATTSVAVPDLPPLDAPPFPATETDRPFAFVHVLDFRDTAQYAEGDADADNTRTGEEAVNTYSANAGQVAIPLGVRPHALLDVQATIIGPVDEWEEVRINWFPSHATFEALTSDPTWQTGSHHRAAGLEKTYALMTDPQINMFSAPPGP